MKRLSHYYLEPSSSPASVRADAAQRFREACDRFGTAYDVGCFCKLIGPPPRGHCDLYGCRLHRETSLSIFDHGVRFRRDGQVTAVIGQPYGYDEARHRGLLENFCTRFGLKLEVGVGWHAPGGTAALTFTRDEAVPLVRARVDMVPREVLQL